MTNHEFWQNQIKELTTTAVAMSNFGEKMAQTAELFVSCLQKGGKILLCDNGGSAKFFLKKIPLFYKIQSHTQNN